MYHFFFHSLFLYLPHICVCVVPFRIQKFTMHPPVFCRNACVCVYTETHHSNIPKSFLMSAWIQRISIEMEISHTGFTLDSHLGKLHGFLCVWSMGMENGMIPKHFVEWWNLMHKSQCATNQIQHLKEWHQNNFMENVVNSMYLYVCAVL